MAFPTWWSQLVADDGSRTHRSMPSTVTAVVCLRLIQPTTRSNTSLAGLASVRRSCDATLKADRQMVMQRGSLLALLNAAKYEQDGRLVEIAGEDVMKNLEEYHVNEQLTMVAYPNRDSTGLRAKYRIPEAKTIKRGNLRYTGFPEVIRCLVELGFMSAAPKDYLSEEDELVWADITRQAIGAESAREGSLSDRIASVCSCSSDEERDQVMECLRWIGLFSSQEKVKPCGSLLDTLCATMEQKMQYQAGEQDMLVLQNKFEIEDRHGQASTRTQTLIEVGSPLGAGKSPFAMARLVGIPCGIAVQLILDGKITGAGVLAPWSNRDLADVLLTEVQREGIMMEEKDLLRSVSTLRSRASGQES